MTSPRCAWVDTAKAMGIFLVFYGHIVEFLYYHGVPVAFHQFKLVYAFHVPLFFFLSGFFWKPAPALGPRIRTLVERRLVPAWSLGALLLPGWLLQQRLTTGAVDWDGIAGQCLAYLRGRPGLNWITWFIICLFTCELLASLLMRPGRARLAAPLVSVGALLSGLYLSDNLATVAWLTGIPANTWFAHESLVALGFYAAGYGLFPLLAKPRKRSVWVLTIPAASAVLLVAAHQNAVGTAWFVNMSSSIHGSPLLFVTAAAAGVALITATARLAPVWRGVTYVGRNTLVLCGLNGAFFHFINPWVLPRILPPHHWLAVAGFCTLGSLASIGLCLPLVATANRWVPRLVGAPRATTPASLPREGDTGAPTAAEGDGRGPRAGQGFSG